MTPELVIRPLQWSVLPALDEAYPVDKDDMACLAEIRAVLARHGKLGRFAIHLAHSHFELAPDEVLIERPDEDGRTQHVTVGRLEDAPDAIPTTWLFQDDEGTLDLSSAGTIYCTCAPTPMSQGACAKHVGTNAPSEEQLKNEAIRDRRIAEEQAQLRQTPARRRKPGDYD
ncbi:hypothetical protein MKK84_00275 [Methylobacterium sp. E-065]|uniref:hypothetical protein n=1 Tax=Methylobacterium sp. E-065 TaxID=2836583 RepID=UPI001FBBD36F|nr:hypothetical protein [Methylobacterium sp. E-065]MCJ2015876.1 hypothetical protein [Methylobacterium sp. E-065]